MPLSIGCIGCGNMGSALMNGLASLSVADLRLSAFNRTQKKLEPLAAKGVLPMTGICEVVEEADLVILAVKPYQIEDVLKEARPFLDTTKIILSVAAGVSMASLRVFAGPDCAIARCMPTTTALVGKGIFAFCFDEAAFPRDRQLKIMELFKPLGYCLELPENRFTDFSAFIGAGPAYVFAVMQGLAQAGLTYGFPLSQSRDMLATLFSGCADLVNATDKTFMQLRDDVCSPGGLTIAGVNVLDRAGISALMVDAVAAAIRKGKEMEA